MAWQNSIPSHRWPLHTGRLLQRRAVRTATVLAVCVLVGAACGTGDGGDDVASGGPDAGTSDGQLQSEAIDPNSADEEVTDEKLAPGHGDGEGAGEGGGATGDDSASDDSGGTNDGDGGQASQAPAGQGWAAFPPVGTALGGGSDGDGGAYRVAPQGDDMGLLQWNQNEVRKPDQAGQYQVVATDTFAAVVDVPGLGVAFQRQPLDRVVWIEAGNGPVEFLVAAETQDITLEGAALDGNDPVVFYQRHDQGGPETSESTLRRFNTATEAVTEIAVTGFWEGGTTFSYVGGSGRAAGVVSAEAVFWQTVLDVATGTELLNPERYCHDGENGCLIYDLVAVDGSSVDAPVYGIGPVRGDDGITDSFGLYKIDHRAESDELLISFTWDNGLWYAEDMFFHQDRLVVSLKDGDDNPLPALVIDLDAERAWTLPDAAFVRPILLP